ncbi:hypothetical protein [Burkholderia sp. S171]|uniref:terminase small subunit-like protein n=1 Tax=Burkholderia sp. S171 TaxID=1641860 RepID=UPI00131E118C|nr:hypothetical protein [Burkholderia sp. S171]
MPVKIIGKQAPQKPQAAEAPPKVKRSRKRITNVGYAPEVFDRIFQYVAAGEKLAEACRRPGMPNAVTVRRRLAVDDKLNDQYLAARKIHLHALADEIDCLPDQAIAKIAKPTGTDYMAWSKQKAENRKWLLQKLLTEFQGLEDGGGTVTLNIIGAPDAPPAPAGTPSKPYVPPGQPVLKIVGGPPQSIAQPAEDEDAGNG